MERIKNKRWNSKRCKIFMFGERKPESKDDVYRENALLLM